MFVTVPKLVLLSFVCNTVSSSALNQYTSTGFEMKLPEIWKRNYLWVFLWLEMIVHDATCWSTNSTLWLYIGSILYVVVCSWCWWACHLHFDLFQKRKKQSWTLKNSFKGLWKILVHLWAFVYQLCIIMTMEFCDHKLEISGWNFKVRLLLQVSLKLLCLQLLCLQLASGSVQVGLLVLKDFCLQIKS